jgi:hypothetical protein
MNSKLAFVALSLAAVGCGPYLQYKTQPPMPPLQGKVIVDVRDSREPGQGGNQHEQVGVHRGSFGIPDTLKVESDTTVADTVHQIIGDAAMAAGLGVAAKGDEAGATARVIVDIQRFWCVGYGGYKGDVSASVQVTDPAGQQVRIPGQPVAASDGGIDCRRIYKKALTDFLVAAKALLSQPQVHGAAVGTVTFAPPPAQ